MIIFKIYNDNDIYFNFFCKSKHDVSYKTRLQPELLVEVKSSICFLIKPNR